MEVQYNLEQNLFGNNQRERVGTSIMRHARFSSQCFSIHTSWHYAHAKKLYWYTD